MEPLVWEEYYDAPYHCMHFRVSVVVFWERFEATCRVTVEALENNEKVLADTKKRLLFALEREIGQWVVAEAMKIKPASESHFSISKAEYQAKTAEALGIQQTKTAVAAYKAKAASEFEGVDGLDDTLWNNGGGLA